MPFSYSFIEFPFHAFYSVKFWRTTRLCNTTALCTCNIGFRLIRFLNAFSTVVSLDHDCLISPEHFKNHCLPFFIRGRVQKLKNAEPLLYIKSNIQSEVKGENGKPLTGVAVCQLQRAKSRVATSKTITITSRNLRRSEEQGQAALH